VIDQEVDDDFAMRAGEIAHLHALPVTVLDLREQRQGIVVIIEAHRFAWIEGFQRAKNRGVAEALGIAAVMMPMPTCARISAMTT
jgi:hypothetical protein